MPSSPRLLVTSSLIALSAAVAGCNNSSSSSNSPTTPTPTIITETFNGSIGQGASAVFSFTVNNSGYNLAAGFTSLSPATITALGLGIGSWDSGSQTCGLNQTQNDTSHSGSTAISGTAGAGSFCIRVYDAGNIPSPDVTATFTVQVEHY